MRIVSGALILALIGAGGCKVRGSGSSSTSGDGENIITPSGDYFDQMSRVNKFLQQEIASHALANAIKATNDKAWNDEIAAGNVPPQAVPTGKTLEKWIKQRAELIVNFDEGDLDWLLTCKPTAENEPHFGGDSCNADSNEYAKALKATPIDFGYFMKPGKAKLLLNSSTTDQEWKEYWESIYKERKADQAFIAELTWLAPDTYQVLSGNCSATVKLNADGTYSLSAVGGSSIECRIYWPEANQASNNGYRLNLQTSFDELAKVTNLIAAKGAQYKTSKFGDNAPFYQFYIKDYDFIDHVEVAVNTNSESFSNSECKLDPALNKGGTTLNEPVCRNTVGWDETKESFSRFNGMTQIAYRFPTITNKYISATKSDLTGVCRQLGGKNFSDEVIQYVGIPTSLTKVMKATNTVVAKVDGNINVTYEASKVPSLVIQDLICYHPHDLYDGQLPSENFCKLYGTEKGSVKTDIRYYYRGKPMYYSTKSDRRGLCHMMGYGKFVEWTTSKKTTKDAISVDVRGVFNGYYPLVSEVVTSVTCDEPHTNGERTGNAEGFPTVAVTNANTRGSTGTDTRGSTSTDTRGSTSTDTRGSTSTDTRGSTSTDTRGSTSTDTRGSTSTDTRGSTSTDTRGSTSTDTRGSTSTDTRGSTGTDTRGSTGTDTRGSTSTTTTFKPPVYKDPQYYPWCPPLPPEAKDN